MGDNDNKNSIRSLIYILLIFISIVAINILIVWLNNSKEIYNQIKFPIILLSISSIILLAIAFYKGKYISIRFKLISIAYVILNWIVIFFLSKITLIIIHMIFTFLFLYYGIKEQIRINKEEGNILKRNNIIFNRFTVYGYVSLIIFIRLLFL